jgi:Retrotransposon gag protein.
MHPETIINITAAMWENVVNRIATQDATIAKQNETIETLAMDYHVLNQRHAALEREHYTLAISKPKLSNSEPKIPDPPMFKGDRKELLPFLTKCQLKFEGQPSQFANDRAKVLYAGTRLEGTPFSWFQPLIKLWPADTSSELAPAEIRSWEAFQESLTSIYGDPNLAATADREIRALKQTGSVAEYAAHFESKKQYLTWNDSVFRDQFYLNLDKEIKNNMAAFGKPGTLKLLKELAIRLDTRLEERRLEIRQEQGRATFPQRGPPRSQIPATTAKSTPAPTSSATVPTTPQTALRVPSHTADGTVPMELDAQGVWRLATSEKERRKRLGLCDYCAAPDHAVASCPVCPPPSNRRPRFERRALLALEVTPESPEKALTQE